MSGLASRKHPAGPQCPPGVEEEGAFGFYPWLAGDLGKSGLNFTFSFLVHLVKVNPCMGEVHGRSLVCAWFGGPQAQTQTYINSI